MIVNILFIPIMNKFFISLFFLVTVRSDMLDILRPKTIRMYKFSGTCPGYENAPIIFKDVHMSLSNRVNIISMKIIGRQQSASNMKLKLALKRCQSREALDSCEKYQGVTINRFCDLINAENTPWSPFVKLAEPPMGCPIRKGVHVVKNGTFDGSAFSRLPISGWYWLVNAKLVEDNTDRVMMCMSMEGQIVPV